MEILQPVKIMYSSPSGEYYFDLLLLHDFLRWLIVKSKKWFSSQHGDRFTLALKTLIQKEVENVRIISWKEKYSGVDGRREVDLLVYQNDTLYAIEAKAYAKSRAYWRGDPGAIKSRGNLLREAVKQAKEASTAVQAGLKAKLLDIPENTSVEWVVCSPTQEYIYPWDKYGHLSEGVPRICTPQELIRHLNRDSDF